MAKLGQPGLTVPQRQEMRTRWRAGESLGDIARTLGRSHRQIERVRAEDGGYGPARRTRAPGALSFTEREEVSRGLAEGVSLRTIAARTRRAPSTISREVA